MRKFAALLLAMCLFLSAAGSAMAADESVQGTLVIYSSMYQYVLDMLDEALKAEFPNLKPGNGDSFFVSMGSAHMA